MARASGNVLSLHIAMISAEYLGVKSGGIGSHVSSLSRYLAKMGHEVHVLTTLEEDSGKNLAPGVWLHHLPAGDTRLLRNALWTLKAGLEVRRIEEEIDVVHAHLPVCSAYPVVHPSRLPLVLTVHTLFRYFAPVPVEGLGERVFRRVGAINDLLATERADKVLACGDGILQELSSLGTLADKTAVVPNGVDWQEFAGDCSADEIASTLEKYGVPKRERKIITVGVLSPRKRIELLIDAMRLLDHTDSGRYGLIIVGDGPARAEIARAAAPLSDAINITGRVPQADLIRLYKASHLLSLPSHYEGLPTVVLEAMASGLPIVATDLPALRKLVTGCGMLVPPEAASLAQAIRDLFSEEDMIPRMGKLARDRAAQYDWSVIARRVEREYRIAIAGKAAVA